MTNSIGVHAMNTVQDILRIARVMISADDHMEELESMVTSLKRSGFVSSVKISTGSKLKVLVKGMGISRGRDETADLVMSDFKFSDDGSALVTISSKITGSTRTSMHLIKIQFQDLNGIYRKLNAIAEQTILSRGTA